MATVSLQIEFLTDSLLAINMMTPTYPLVKPQLLQEATQLTEPDIRVRPTAEYLLEKLSLPTHAKLYLSCARSAFSLRIRNRRFSSLLGHPSASSIFALKSRMT